MTRGIPLLDVDNYNILREFPLTACVEVKIKERGKRERVVLKAYESCSAELLNLYKSRNYYFECSMHENTITSTKNTNYVILRNM